MASKKKRPSGKSGSSRKKREQHPSVSVAIPIYNEESVLPELYRRLRDVLADIPGEHQIVFVDDGSREGVREILSGIAMADPRVKVVSLARNFGHQTALTAALEYATGDLIVMMDGDLQDTPETIPRFLAKHREGYDVVYAVRKDRKESWLMRTAYSSFYKLIGWLSDIELPQSAGDFSMITRRAADAIRQSPEQNRYLRGLRAWVGFRQTGIEVERASRHSGESKYSFRKLFRLAFDGIISFSLAPLRAATLVGICTTIIAVLIAVYALVSHLFLERSPAGYTTLISAITFFAGVQLLFLGVIGEYIGRIYEEVKRRPHFVVDQVITAESLESGSTRALDELVQPTGVVANALPAATIGSDYVVQ